ncbi:thiolase domain-containing protein [Thermopolyspora sp. NPDC052614]|uniref:thiolase domain-containing protein n=1 Tax=Thermopolyspora sp. NPDC052614 TaxID=3155682 RepID=UPI00344A91B8
MGRVMARIAGAFEHPRRNIPDRSLESVYLEIAAGALADAGLAPSDVDALITSVVPGGPLSLAELLGLGNLRHIDGTDLGGATYVSSLGAAARAIQAGRCKVALIIHAGLPRQGIGVRGAPPSPTLPFEAAHGSTLIAQYALVARRHMYEYGTRREDLAQIKVAAAYHASFNPHALLRDRVTVEEVIDSPPIAEPLHRLDCCVTTDGGGAIVVVSEEIAASLGKPCPGILAQAETVRHWNNGNLDLTVTGASRSGPQAFEQAGLTPADIDYVSIYDSFTITVLTALEDLGFCAKGEGAKFVQDGALQAPHGRLPFNTDGGGLANNHPDRRGGMIRSIEAVRQLRGEAHPELQVPDCEFALVHGSGFSLGSRASASTAILCRGDVK